MLHTLWLLGLIELRCSLPSTMVEWGRSTMVILGLWLTELRCSLPSTLVVGWGRSTVAIYKYRPTSKW